MISGEHRIYDHFFFSPDKTVLLDLSETALTPFFFGSSWFYVDSLSQKLAEWARIKVATVVKFTC